MKTLNLLTIGLFAMASWSHAQSDTLRYEHDRMDSLVLENPGTGPQRIDSVFLTRLQGSANAYHLEFTLDDSLFIASFAYSRPRETGTWGKYEPFRGATIPAGGHLTFRGKVVNIPTACPCEDAGASPEPHLFRLQFFGPGFHVTRYLQGTVATRSWMGTRTWPRLKTTASADRHVRADGKTIGVAPRASLSFPIPAR